MLSAANLWEYCRTCFVKFGEVNVEVNCKFVSIKKFPDLRDLIRICLSNSTTNEDGLYNYAPFICPACFDKWSEFSKFYHIAIKTDEKIRKVLKKELPKTASGDGKNISAIPNEKKKEYIRNTDNSVDEHIIEKYEMSSSFFVNSQLTNIYLKDKHILIPTNDPTQLFNQQNSNSVKLVSKSNEDSKSYFSEKISEYDFPAELKKNLQNPYKTRNAQLKSEQNMSCSSDNGKKIKKNRFQCEECNKYFWEKNKYDGHMKQVHDGIKRPYKCSQCDKSYNLYKTLLQHKREYHSEKILEAFKCTQCDKIFKTGVILKQHVNNKHSERKESLRSICDQCGFIAAHQYSLARHIINRHTETDQIKCDQCPKVFKTRYSLKYHVIGHHNQLNPKPFKCPECQMEFTRKTLLNQHKRTHLNYTERIKCDFEGCEVRFVKRGDKTHHMRLVHLKIKQHICDICGVSFGAMQTLRHHHFIHTGEKPYKCNVCGQGFRQRTAMKTHQKTHFGKELEPQDLMYNVPETNSSSLSNFIS